MNDFPPRFAVSPDFTPAIVTGNPCEHMHRQTMNLRWGPEGEPLRLEQAWVCIACGDTIWQPIPKAPKPEEAAK